MASTLPSVVKYDGTTDLAISIYPEIDAGTLAGPEFPYKAPQKTFRARVAKMHSPTHPPVLNLETNIELTSKYWYPAYSEQVALSLVNRPKMFTGLHYNDKHVLSPVKEIGHECAEELALSPVDRPKMFVELHYSDMHALSPIEKIGHGYAEELALSPVNQQHRKSRGCEVNKPENYCFTVVAPVHGRNRKHRIGEDDEPARKSKRSRKIISYAE
jgi:hypothetical protein